MEKRKLTDLEARKMVSEIRSGNKQTKKLLHSLMLVTILTEVNKHVEKGFAQQELIEQGIAGLEEAVKEFNTEQRDDFEDYAMFKMEKAIIQYVHLKSRK